MKKVIYILFSLLFISNYSFAQDDDEKKKEKQEPNKEGVTLEQDSSWLKGPQTTWYINQDDWYKIHFEEHVMDSSYTHLHRYEVYGQNGFRYQTLGNNASALHSYWEQPTGNLGQDVGITAFDPYAQDLDTWEYYSAYIPVTDFNGVVGQDNRGKIGGKIGRNINPYWAAGLLFQRYSEPYVVGRDKISNSYNGQVHTSLGFNTRYESKNNRYKLLASFYQYFHEGPESGGLAMPSLVTDETPIEDLFKLGRGQLTNYFQDGVSSFKWNYNYHLYHQYALVDTAKLQVFHEFTRNSYRYQYANSVGTISTNKLYYDQYNDYTVEAINNLPPGAENDPNYVPPLVTDYSYGELPYTSIKEQYIDNKIGVKSRLGPTFWSGFMRYRYYKYQQQNSNDFVPVKIDNQLFVGGDVELLLPKKLGALTGHGEFELLNQNAYNLTADVTGKYLKGGFIVEQTLAPMMTQYFSTVFMSWNDKKDPVKKQQIHIAPQLPLGEKGNIEIFGEVNNIIDYIYYDKYARPQQYDQSIAYNRFGTKFKVRTGNIQQIAEVVYTQNSHQDVMPTPDVFGSYEVSYVREFRDGMISIYAGIDTHYTSAFYGYAFNPVSQQFHLQDDYKTEGYFNFDVFIDFKMRRCMAFVRISDILNAVDPTTGYWASPGYMGPGFGISYGVRWLMFE
ncbi:putative porin [Flammeovirga kamogawensis]|uniref:Porin n=1 Tax=Flammeovirga kamogawensis TaxID=373891 RepID=A0ABX8GW76_9BACT|nr:putative porin [Flammeovirga kamogawensis]MBB6461301.1 hypothetical protein [Flammeovirga kamogawensis]QWG07858.1 hypothetical protein KM029_02645 [Flammeovirga kamogawensis]TRX69665.1 hypothetical protein EO216_16580 [Flammeovirga kamogawensis]